MWKFSLFIGAVIAWPDSAIGQQEYLTTVDGWRFYKLPVTGLMTNANIKATCETAGMRHPCFYTGTGCTGHWHESECLVYNGGSGGCITFYVLSEKLCGTLTPWTCIDLDDAFVYIPYWSADDSAWGVDHDGDGWGLHGANYRDKYALCAEESPEVITG
ncbi:uncharacterized protein LOC144863282 [Branchiostoma floridae x Branchiostoma japonicum]